MKRENSFGYTHPYRLALLSGSCFRSGLAALLLFAFHSAVNAQFQCTTNAGAITITRYTGTGGVLAIPSTITGLPVIGIGPDAFYNSAGLTEVIIPAGV